MAQPSNTFAPNDMKGIRESLSDIIHDIRPVETPFMSSVERVDVSNTTHEWQVDSLAAASNNAVIEGDDASTDASSATSREKNFTQISDKVARVSGTGRSVNTAGRADELDYQMLKRGRELRRDMETVLMDNQARVTGNDSTARQMAGVPAWLATNVDKASDGTNPTGDGSDSRIDGTARAFTEDQLKTVLKDVFDEGGMPDTLMVGPFNRQVASTFLDNRTAFQKAEDEALHATFNVYESDFGELRIVPNRFQRGQDAFVLEMEKWAVGFLPGRDMATVDLAKTGDTDRRQIISEYTLEARNEKANGIIADLTTS